MSAHAKYSPSKAELWMNCPGGLAADAQFPDKPSSHAEWGTAAHELTAECLITGGVAHASLGHRMGNSIEVDQEMVEAVQFCVDRVREMAHGSAVLIEQRVDFSLWAAGVAEQSGTLDAGWIDGDELVVVDHKFGRGVAVDARENKQLRIYALGMLQANDPAGLVERVRLVILQPRNGGVSEWSCTVDELLAFGEEVKAAIARAEAPDAPRVPGPKQCQWCKAKGTCPELAAKVEAETLADFASLTPPATTFGDDLPQKMAMVDLVEDWCKAVRAEAERRLLAGEAVTGWKLVQGRNGARKWSDPVEAEAALKAMRVPHDKMYDYSVISPTSAEKLAKAGTIGPRQWPKLKPLITQSAGGPSVAPESDKRPALSITPLIDDFVDQAQALDLV